jgi:hypothetical protein
MKQTKQTASSAEAVHALKFFAQAEQLTLFHVLNVSNMVTRVEMEEYRGREQTMREDGERLLEYTAPPPIQHG